jgi:hypothetical protein
MRHIESAFAVMNADHAKRDYVKRRAPQVVASRQHVRRM